MSNLILDMDLSTTFIHEVVNEEGATFEIQVNL